MSPCDDAKKMHNIVRWVWCSARHLSADTTNFAPVCIRPPKLVTPSMPKKNWTQSDYKRHRLIWVCINWRVVALGRWRNKDFKNKKVRTMAGEGLTVLVTECPRGLITCMLTCHFGPYRFKDQNYRSANIVIIVIIFMWVLFEFWVQPILCESNATRYCLLEVGSVGSRDMSNHSSLS